MSRFVAFCACAFWLAALPAAADPAANWQEYRSAGGGFKIEMPGEPETIESEFGTQGQKMHGFAFSRDKSGGSKQGAMLAMASDLVGERKPENTEKNLDTVRDTAMQTMGAKLVRETRETVSGEPARRIDYAGNGYFGTLLVVLAERRMYQVNAMGPEGYSGGAEAKRFLDSFALVGN
ncbi:MAG TPA: hypothetical protein VHD34_10105 [Xanthobacteraceae bacterium]|nr:hypothetical protein [Xanthobacteraceae bacterium]